MINPYFEYELERRITKHLEAWADWSKMSEADQNETFDEIFEIVKWALDEKTAHDDGYESRSPRGAKRLR